jgi:hypothetical protein
MFSSVAQYPFLKVSDSSAHLEYVQVSSLSFGNTISSTNPLVYLDGDSTVDFKDGTFNGISSLSTSGAIFSDAGSSLSTRTVVVRINGKTFQGLIFFFFFFFFDCDVLMNLLISFFLF